MFEGLPRNHYGAILADPPWQFRTWSDKGAGRSASNHYETMDNLRVAALPVADLAAPDCVLFLWVSSPMIEYALELTTVWGFKYKTFAFVWTKADQFRFFAAPSMGLGYWTRSNAEVCLLATRGKPKRLNADVRQIIIEPRREHSRKPDCVHDRIQRLVGGPYLELFARQTRKNWDCWGNETTKFELVDD
jgi:N6-adenosine-specific RNA methylase IME4